jgi:hypothetical protein
MVGQLAEVPPAHGDDLDVQIKKAEEAYDRAFAQQQAMGRYNVSDVEAAGIHRVIQNLEKKASVLRARRFALAHGVAPVEEPAAPHRADDDELQKMRDTRIERHEHARIDQEVKYRIVVTKTDEKTGRILEFEKVPIPIGEPAGPGPIAAVELNGSDANNDNDIR